MHGRGVAGACVAGGMHGRGVAGAWQGACVAGGHAWQGVCMAGDVQGMCGMGGHVWQGGMHGWVHAWQGSMCGEEGMCGRGVREACVAGEMAIAADGTLPTGMHSCTSSSLVLFYQ